MFYNNIIGNIYQEYSLITQQFIIDSINNKENEFILDIATGRRALFTEIVKQLKVESQIVCTDLSFVVLKHDRLRAKKNYSRSKSKLYSLWCNQSAI